jgi:catechol 2,3-dioxygenase-like lactoylglutathione lyase family enzyme
MDRPSHAGLRHLALNVRDMTAMKRFYVELLGFAIEWEPDPDNVYLSSGLDNLALHRSTTLAAGRSTTLAAGRSTSLAAGSSETAPPFSPLDHLGVIVRAPGDVDQWAAFLEAQGVVIDAPPRTHRDGARSCYFRDPDGNKVQVIHHPPISGKA